MHLRVWEVLQYVDCCGVWYVNIYFFGVAVRDTSNNRQSPAITVLPNNPSWVGCWVLSTQYPSLGSQGVEAARFICKYKLLRSASAEAWNTNPPITFIRQRASHQIAQLDLIESSRHEYLAQRCPCRQFPTGFRIWRKSSNSDRLGSIWDRIA
jgi:hypothetical protein